MLDHAMTVLFLVVRMTIAGGASRPDTG